MGVSGERIVISVGVLRGAESVVGLLVHERRQLFRIGKLHLYNPVGHRILIDQPRIVDQQPVALNHRSAHRSYQIAGRLHALDRAEFLTAVTSSPSSGISTYTTLPRAFCAYSEILYSRYCRQRSHIRGCGCNKSCSYSLKLNVCLWYYSYFL